jgi:hypothetical protein
VRRVLGGAMLRPSRMEVGRASATQTVPGSMFHHKAMSLRERPHVRSRDSSAMLEEAIYLFLDQEFSADAECASCFGVINPSSKFLQDIENHFVRFEFDAIESDETGAELKPLSRRKLVLNMKKTKTILLVDEKSLLQLEFSLRESSELIDQFREVFCNEGLLFLVESWDATYFWTGASTKRWFNARFPREAKKTRYAKPPSVLDLLYEYLESVPQSPDGLLTLKKAVLRLSAEDRSFIDDLLSGKRAKQDSKEIQETSARILYALKVSV